MNPLRLSRREMLKTTAFASAGLGLGLLNQPQLFAAEKQPLFGISLAQWSLHRTIRAGKLDNLQFPEFTKKEFGIEAVEYVNQFFKDKAKDQAYLKELKQRSDDNGVRNVLIMCDGEGHLGDADDKKRTQAVENHYRWVEAAKFLGCHSIRVNAHSTGSEEEQRHRVVDGLRRLSQFAGSYEINVIVENHGGLSSNGAWLASVMKEVNLPNCGTLPDFGNFHGYDRYKGVEETMPFAKGVSAKSHAFDENGNERNTDYRRMMKIVLDAGYRGYVGIEWEGGEPSEPEGIMLTKKLLERVREELSS